MSDEHDDHEVDEHVMRVARFAAAEAIIRGRDPIEAAVRAVNPVQLHTNLINEVADLKSKLKSKCGRCSLALPIRDLDLSVRAMNMLESAGLSLLSPMSDLCKFSEQELLAVKNCARTTTNEIQRKLVTFGCALKANET
jgi:DNA-directed RNA polymerase alpha subunit